MIIAIEQSFSNPSIKKISIKVNTMQAATAAINRLTRILFFKAEIIKVL